MKSETQTRAEKRREERKKKEDEKHMLKKQKQAIIMLNGAVKTRLGASRDKVCVYAMRAIRKNERLYANSVPCMLDVPYKMFDEIRPEVKEMIFEHFPQVINGSHFMCPDTLMQMYVQHSEEPNYDAVKDIALKGISKGEEVTQDFTKMKDWDKIKKVLKQN